MQNASARLISGARVRHGHITLVGAGGSEKDHVQDGGIADMERLRSLIVTPRYTWQISVYQLLPLKDCYSIPATRQAYNVQQADLPGSSQ